MLRTIITSICFVLFLILQTVPAGAVEPQHEFEKPGFHKGHAYDGIIPEEMIDLFTGGLLISQRDVRIHNLSGIERFEKMITRRYTSKIFRQQINGGTCVANSTSIEDEFVGIGWDIHFGRLWDFNQFGTGHPVLELPDGTRHVFSSDTNFPGKMISRSGWTLEQTNPQPVTYHVCSPEPDSICMRFFDMPELTDTRDGRQVLHAKCWFYAGWVVGVSGGGHIEGNILSYNRDASGHLWPTEAHQNCAVDADPRWTTFNWDPSKLQPTLDSVTFHGLGGVAQDYTYQYITQNGHNLLTQFSTPEGRTYKYDYDPITNELIRITVSMDSVIDSSDLVIEYTYNTQTFLINPFFLSSACSRVITQKKVKKADGSFDVWTYQYPSGTPHKVTVTDPKGNKREVTFQGYSTGSPIVWNVGKIIRDEVFQGTTSLVSEAFTYDFKQVTATPDPEAASYDTVKIPVLLSSTKTYTQTAQQTTTSYGTAVNYDRYGNPDFKIENNFDGSVLRTTQYQYEHRDGDSDDALMESSHYVHDISKIKVLDPSGQRVSEVSYDHYNITNDVRFGALKDVFTWDSETNSDIRKTYDYSWRRQNDRIYEQTEGNDRLTTSWNGICSGITFWWQDGFETEAGPLYQGEVDMYPWLITSTLNSNSQTTSYTYDNDQRLKSITPPEGDAISITYDDANRKVTVNQGNASTIENYDSRGRLSQSQVKISSGVLSTQTFEYDALDNLTKQSEKSLNTPDTFVTKVYDVLNRITSIATFDGTTTYTYNGPDVTITVASEIGALITTMKYDAAGRLIKVVEPNGTATTYAYDPLDQLIRVCHNDSDDVCAADHSNRRDFVYSSRGKLLSETHPESGTTTYAYDKLGHLIQRKLAGMSQPILYQYDARDRLIQIDYPNDPDVTFYYDGNNSSRKVPGYENQFYGWGIGSLTGMVDSTATTLFIDHNIRNLLEHKELHLNGISNPIVVRYTHDGRGNQDSITYPSGQVVSTPRNDGNAINLISRQFGGNPATNLVNSISYNAAFLPSNISYGNGVNLDISSDPRNRPDLMNSTGKLTFDYRYNARGLIDQVLTSQNGAPSQPRDITYDNLGRVATFTAGGSTATYNFDIYGNLLSKTGALVAGPFTYTNNRINGVSYSASGNQLSANGKTLVYNEENRLQQVIAGPITTTYSYDGKGNRAKALDSATGKARYFVYDEGGSLLSEMSQLPGGTLYVDKEYVQGPGGTVATANLDEIPRSLKIYDLNGKVRLEWAPLASCAIAGYNVYRSLTQNGTYTLINTGGPVTTGSFDDANVTECTTYWYQIKTVYTGGAEGPASSKRSHQFKNLRATLYNSPSPGIAPLVETFTYNKAGGCPSASASNYGINFGDGSTQNFGTSGSVQHTYNTSSSCYPFCIATLTVTFTNGIIATRSVLTSMSTNLVIDENFDDGVANGFTIVSGTWTAGAGTYTGSSTGTAWGISLSPSTCNNCIIQAQANTAAQTNKNAYVVFGYVDSKNFQYAGYDISASKWVIGDVVNNTNTVRASFTQTLATGVWHSLEIKLEASTKTVTLKGNGVTRCMYIFSTLYSLPIGFAVKGVAQSGFDNFKIAPSYAVTTLHNEDFNDGVANGYVPATGTWSIVSSRYRGTISTATDAVSVTPLSSFNSGIISGDIRVVTNNGWMLFDYVNATNFKFAGVDATADLWIIGM